MRIVIITTEGDDLDVLKDEKGTEPTYQKKLADRVFSGLDVFVFIRGMFH